jgi:hypothetical protein
VQPVQYVDTNQLGSKKSNETRTAVVVPKSRLLSHVSSSTAVDLSQLLPDESGTPLLGRSKSLRNLAVKEHDNNESNPHTKPVNVNKLRENNNTMFWVSATAEVGRVMVMAGRMEAIVAKVVLVASGGSTLRMNLGITKDLQSITLVTEYPICLAKSNPEMHLSISSNPAAMEVIRIDRLPCQGLRSSHCRFLLGHPQGDLSR